MAIIIISSIPQEPKSLSSLPQRGAIVPLPQPPITQLSSMDYETSVSYCESERGTHGRGTPPPMDMSQPRLDDLFRQLHVSLRSVDTESQWWSETCE